MNRDMINIFIAVLFVAAWTLQPLESTAKVLSKNKAAIFVDGERIHGLQGFGYKLYKPSRWNDPITEINIRPVRRGENWKIKGRILIRSDSDLLNMFQMDETVFQITIKMKQESFSKGDNTKRLTIEDCQIVERKLLMNAQNRVTTEYIFIADQMIED